MRDWPLRLGDCWKCGGSGKVCRVCDGMLKLGMALIPGIYGSEDFGGDYGEPGTTRSEGPGDGAPRECLKCVDCGHSFIERNV